MPSIKITYSQIQDIPLQLELWLPFTTATEPIQVIAYFHGGALMAGGKNDVLFAGWLKDASLKAGFAFAGVDYPLIHPFTANDQIVHVKELFRFLACPDITSSLPKGVQLNSERVAVAGFSAGAYLCRLAAIHASPKPVALLSAFGMGGRFLTDTFVVGNKMFPLVGLRNGIRNTMFLLDIPRSKVASFVDDPTPRPCVDSPLIIDATGAVDDAAGRWNAALWMFVEGIFLDYHTGIPGFSAEMRKVPVAERYAKVTEMGLAGVFPEIQISMLGEGQADAFPPSFIFHGGADPLILPEESVATYEALKKAGVKTELRILEGAVHGLVDLEKGALHADTDAVQEEAFQFLATELKK